MLEAVGCTPVILIAAPSSAYHGGLLALGTPPPQEETSGDSTPSRTRLTVVLTYRLIAWTCAC